MRTELRADQIGAAAREDLQFTVPRLPALRLGVRLRALDDMVLLDGADRAQAFTGSFARDRLIAIAERCDGTSTHVKIAEVLEMDEQTVSTCLALLWTAGAIEEAGRELPPPVVAPPLAVFLSRLGNATGVNASWTGAITRARARAVALTGDSDLVSVARSLFADVCRLASNDEEPALTVFFETANTSASERAQAEKCRGALLRIRADSGRIVIGPYVDRVITPCLSCGTRGDEAISSAVAPHLQNLIVGLAAHHVLSLIGRTIVSHLPGDTCVVALPTLTTTVRPIATVPGCPDCSFAEGPVATEVPVGALYEASVALPPRAFLSPRDHQAHYYTGNQELQSRFRTWPSRARIPLPAFSPSLLPKHVWGRSPRALTPKLLSGILSIAFGINQETSKAHRIDRWTASGGNIGGTTACVILRDDIVGAQGVYAYAPDSHALVHLSDRIPSGYAPCELVITGDLQKIMSKYGTFGLRLAFLDAGCNLASARAVAAHLGIDFRIFSSWDDSELAAAIGIDLQKEPIAAVAAIGGTHAI